MTLILLIILYMPEIVKKTGNGGSAKNGPDPVRRANTQSTATSISCDGSMIMERMINPCGGFAKDYFRS